VWALADPNAVVEHAAAIERAFRNALGARDRDRHRVTVSAGLIEHVDTKGLWNTGNAALPSEAQARQQATKVIATVSKALSPQGDPTLAKALGPVLLSPPQLQPIDLFRIASPQTGAFDHWLMRSRPRLTLKIEDGSSAEVFGAEVDVRIGPGGAVLSYLSRWRPLLGEHVDVPLAAPPEEEGEGGGQGQPKQGIVYVLEGESIPQHYLAPYYITDHGHDLDLSSACELSLVVHVVPYSTDDPSQYVAVVDGGSGDYVFDWGLLGLSDLGEGTLTRLGEGETVRDRSTTPESTLSVVKMPPGAHLALVNVIDRDTGAFRHHSEQIYVAPAQSAAQPVA
jgi:hypothetical protein